MIKNNKGAILVVTIVSMMILTIIGYVTLQMVSNQNVMDTYDQTKIRVDYAAEGIVERARGYIDYITMKKSTSTPASDGDIGAAARGYLSSVVDSSAGQKWLLLETAEDIDCVKKAHEYDSSMYPHIRAGDIYCEHVDGTHDGIDCPNLETVLDDGTKVIVRSYRIIANAYAKVNVAGGSDITSTVAYYFCSKHKITSEDIEGITVEHHETSYHSLGWRKS